MNESELHRQKIKNMNDSSVVFEKDIALMRIYDPGTGSYHAPESDFTVIHLDIDAVLHNLDSPETIMALKAEELEIDQVMMELIDLIEKGEKPVPPIIYMVGDKFAIFDGKQRIALCRHLHYKTIPFLVRKQGVDKIQSIVRGL